MSEPTLFSHLIQRFGLPSENLATEALGFILDRSPGCKRAVRDLATMCGAAVGETIAYRTQVADESGGRPDVVGTPPDGRAQVILEGKFWAGLTENQPRGYLAQLHRGRPGILIFVAPADRFTTLWPEIRALCHRDGISDSDTTTAEEVVASTLASGHVVAMVSWRALLGRMSVAADTGHERSVCEDIAQLQSVCEIQDRKAFLPLRREELTDQAMAQRMAGYYPLLGDIVQVAVQEGIASTSGLRPGGAPPRYGRYMNLGMWQVFLANALDLWAEYGCGPLWLSFTDWTPVDVLRSGNTNRQAEAAERLSPLASRGQWSFDRGPVLIVPSNGRPIVGLPLPIAVERHRVVTTVVGQLRQIHGMLGGIPFTFPVSQSVPPSDEGPAEGDLP